MLNCQLKQLHSSSSSHRLNPLHRHLATVGQGDAIEPPTANRVLDGENYGVDHQWVPACFGYVGTKMAGDDSAHVRQLISSYQSGRWSIYLCGRWPVAGGRWPVAGGRWLMAGGRCPVAGGRWLMAGGRWPVAGGRWPVSDGRWPVAGGRWPVAGDIK